MQDYATQQLNAKLKEEEDYLEKLPKCKYCGEPIQDDYLFYINGETICEDCANDNFKYSTETFMD